MARAQHLLFLSQKVFGEIKTGEGSVPSVLKTIQRAVERGLDYHLMSRLNYTDLQAVLIEFDIRDLQNELDRQEAERLSSRGISRRKASASDIQNLIS